MAVIDMKKLTTIDRVIVGASLVALISMFLPWYGASSSAFSTSVSGFGSGYGWIGSLLVVAAGTYLALLRSGNNVPRTSMGPGVIVLGLSLIGTLLVAFRWLALPSGSAGIAGVTYFNYGPRMGIIITLIAAIVQVICSFTLFRRSGESLPWAK
jgi:hypothetical protein